MIHEYTCNTLEEVKLIISSLQSETDKKLFFRGQCKDYPFTPSINRPFIDKEEKQLYDIRHSIVENLICQHFCTTSKNDENIDYFMTTMAILQHYGLKSWFIDITTNIEVAIWFSKMKFHQEKVHIKNDSCYKEDGSPSSKPLDHSVSTLPISNYKQSEEEFGWLYIIGLDTIEVEKYILDLNTQINSLRIKRQYGAGFFDPEFNNIDLNSFVIAKIKVSTKICINSDINTRHLFPSWEEDEVYKSLLNVPHVILEKDLKDHMSKSLDLIDIPIYIEDKEDKKEIFSVASYIRQLIGLYIHRDIFPKLPKDCVIISKPISMKRVFHNNQYIDINKEELNRSKKIQSYLLGKHSLKELLSHWPTPHFILLYSAFEMVPRYLGGSSTYPIVRATRFNIKDEFIELFAYNEDLVDTYEVKVTYDKYPEEHSSLIVELIDLSLDIEENKLGIWKKNNALYNLHWLDHEGKPIYPTIGEKL